MQAGQVRHGRMDDLAQAYRAHRNIVVAVVARLARRHRRRIPHIPKCLPAPPTGAALTASALRQLPTTLPAGRNRNGHSFLGVVSCLLIGGAAAMHPVSASDPRSHPACADAIVALATCHKERSIAKFFGACNDFKAALDQCMRSEKKERRERNRREAREFDMNWHALRESMRQKDV